MMGKFLRLGLLCAAATVDGCNASAVPTLAERPRSLSVLADLAPTLSNNHDLGNGDKVRYLSQISGFFVSI